jgi:hypothetical protein
MPRFEWKNSRFAPDTAEQAEHWMQSLERAGLENVALTIAQKSPVGLRAAIWVAGAQMTKGFAEHWLADQTKREARSRAWRPCWTAARAVGRVVSSGPAMWGAAFGIVTAVGLLLKGRWW